MTAETTGPLTRAHRLTRMTGRNAYERHRTATALELLFDLTFVVAFGFASDELAHAITIGSVGSGLYGFAFSMFAIVWAWINFTWFASAFDVDDWVYRLVTMVQMLGVLILALGIPPLFASLEHGGHVDNRVMVLGYVVMRVAMIVQWLRAAAQSPPYRSACLGYAAAIGVAQIGWVALIFTHVSVGVYIACATVLTVVELTGPAVAERWGATPWHAHHIAERYGLLAIIALGEGIIGTATALSAVIEANGWGWQVVAVGLAGVGLTFGLWWSYFTMPSAEVLHLLRNARAFPWGYGHIAIFASIAAVGAGLHVAAVAMESEHGPSAESAEAAEHAVSSMTAVLAVVIPVAAFTVALYLIYTVLMREFDRFHLLLLAVTAVFVVLPVLLAAAHVDMPICLLVLTLAPITTVVGYEVLGHAHQSAAVARLQARVRD